MMTFFKTRSSRFTDKGFTLTELIIVVVIVSVLAALAGLQMNAWMGRARVLEETKQIYADLGNARLRAKNRNRLHFVSLNVALNRYQIWEDTDPAPDGNGVLTAADTRVQEVTIKDRLFSSAVMVLFNFDSQGIISQAGWIRIENAYGAVNDCIAVSATRIRMGRWDSGTATCSQ